MHLGFILGFALKFVYRNKVDDNSNSETLISTPQKGDALVKSVLDGAKGMFAICAFVVLFSAFTEIFCSHITDENIQNRFDTHGSLQCGYCGIKRFAD